MTHDYGPHREADAPQEVTVLPERPTNRDGIQKPMPQVLRRQRAIVNTMAYEARSQR